MRDRIFEILFILFMLWLVFCVIGCVSDGKLMFKSEKELIQSKLNSIVQLEGHMGAMIGYTNSRLNSPEFRIERWFQVNQHLVPKTQVDFQKLMKARSHMKGKYGYE